ncbi:hypothetical protein AAG906_025150 [Vitis piasezkii]
MAPSSGGYFLWMKIVNGMSKVGKREGYLKERYDCGMFAIKYMQHWNGATLAHSIVEYDAFDIGFITTDDFTNVDISEATYPAVAKRLYNDWINGPAIPIVTGLLGKGWKSGAVTTLGRGGSDLIATSIGGALGLQEIQSCGHWQSFLYLYHVLSELIHNIVTLHQFSTSLNMSLHQFRSSLLVNLYLLMPHMNNPALGTLQNYSACCHKRQIVRLTAKVEHPKSIVLPVGLKWPHPIPEGPFAVVINQALHKKIKHVKPINLELATTYAECSLHFGGPLEASMFLLKTGVLTCDPSIYPRALHVQYCNYITTLRLFSLLMRCTIDYLADI